MPRKLGICDWTPFLIKQIESLNLIINLASSQFMIFFNTFSVIDIIFQGSSIEMTSKKYLITCLNLFYVDST